MTVETFFNLLLKELQDNKQFWSYYKFLESPDKINFRKAYFCQRLEYILNHVPTNATKIWDCGCGYGTTAIFLALNGFPVYGNTLEFYYEHIPKRLKYWQQFGDISTFEYSYDNHFDLKFPSNTFDAVIAQDTLHHLEPMDEALKIIFDALKKEGIVIAIEENGNNILQNTKLYLQRGNKRIIAIQDEKLNKSILLGNENIRSIQHWKNLFIKNGFQFNTHDVAFIRYFLPAKAQQFNSTTALIAKEKAIQSTFLKNYLFFGINFTATK